jgi:predicted DCC family thiol-disulfide oxidoreductase YuxK
LDEIAAAPVLLFDGDCAFCRLWVGYWQRQTGERVSYSPWQTSLEQFPGITAEECKQAVQFVGPQGSASGAHAAFLILAFLPRYRWLLWLYNHLPGFGAITEWGYRLIAAHRDAGYRVTRLLWGNHVEPSTWDKPVAWFRRGLAAVYFFAFASFGLQVRGLIGEKGILPLGMYLQVAEQQLGPSARWKVPTLFWWGHSDYTILYIAWGGAALAFLSLVARSRSKWYPALAGLMFIYYLSLVSAGQIFMSYQWDYLLLETGFLTIFVRPTRSRVWLLHWLLFRLMFESGLVKLSSHDPTWRSLTALTFHYETQPLPTPLAWYMHQAPLWAHKFSTLVMFAIELGAPFLIFGPRRMKHLAAIAIIGLQIMIAATGNYTFFNLLAMVLCITLFDDASWPGKMQLRQLKPPQKWLTALLVTGAVVFSVWPWAPLAPYGLVNQYGLFANMTTIRREITIEGSLDGDHWEPYVFRYKPGALNSGLRWVAPHQPRLDWQMWFAALGPFRDSPWFARLALTLLQGSQPVTDLFEKTPFGATPPRYIRATIDRYQFTRWEERSKTGNWWKREPQGLYFPQVSLR